MNTILSALITIAVIATTRAAQPVEQGYFPFSIGAGGLDYGKAIAVDGNDNVIVAALYNLNIDADPGSNGVVSISSSGGTDVLLAKYTPYGSLLWAKRHGWRWEIPPSIDAPHAVAADSSNNVVVAGYFGSATANDRASDFDPGDGMRNRASPPTNHALTRCSFYAIIFHP